MAVLKLRRKGNLLSWNRVFLCALMLSLACATFSSFSFTTFSHLGVSFRPVIISSGRKPALNAVNSDYTDADRKFRQPTVEIQDSVVFPDQTLLFLKTPLRLSAFTNHGRLQCAYLPPDSSKPHLDLRPISADRLSGRRTQILRCALPPRGFLPSISLPDQQQQRRLPLPARRPLYWDSLVYESLIDADNTTVVFIKGLNLRPGRASDASRLECLYGWEFSRQKFLLSSAAVTAAQEIVRCETPPILLKHPQKLTTMKVSVRAKGRRKPFDSVARLNFLPETHLLAGSRKQLSMCICTMVRNQARFLREWVIYHARIGVQRWFIYDNNSDDDIVDIVKSLSNATFNVSRHVWPWVKTQEAGFAHCALRARASCEWIGFLDVDEFLYLPSSLMLPELLLKHSISTHVGELRIPCHSFGPSGLRKAPKEGVTVGYNCRIAARERHKSIVRPEALNLTLINVVHHFHLKDGYEYLNLNTGKMVINHYKYQVWEVFKEKFYRRVATYVADWQDEEKAGSKDRAPGLGTKAIEPLDWASRFCEVADNGLRDWVLKNMKDKKTGLLPWQDGFQEIHQ